MNVRSWTHGCAASSPNVSISWEGMHAVRVRVAIEKKFVMGSSVALTSTSVLIPYAICSTGASIPRGHSNALNVPRGGTVCIHSLISVWTLMNAPKTTEVVRCILGASTLSIARSSGVSRVRPDSRETGSDT